MKIKEIIKNSYLDIIVVFIVMLISDYYFVQGDLTTYIATPMAMVDSSIFNLDFSIMEFIKPNAQSISDLFCAGLMKLGLSWFNVSIVGYIITAIVFGGGIIAISKHFCKKNSWIMSGFLMFLSIYALAGLRIGRNPIWFQSFYYAQIAFPIAIWSFYYALNKKWKNAFILVAIATLFHFTAGSYCAAYLVVFLLIDCIKNKSYKDLLWVIPWVAICFGIFIMMYLGDSTNTGLLSGKEFVKIHAFLRHPHHHVPSSWEAREWVVYICYIFGVYGALLYIKQDTEHFKTLNHIFLVSTTLMSLILLINYVFVEIIPLSFIAKLQPARCVFIYRFFLAAILAFVVQTLWNKKDFIPATLLIAFATIPQIDAKTSSGFFVLALGILLVIKLVAQKKKLSLITQLIPIGYLILFIVFAYHPLNKFIAFKMYFRSIGLITLFFFMSLELKLNSSKIAKLFKRVIIIGCSALLIVLPWYNVDTNKMRTVNQYFLGELDPFLITLAERFEENSDKDVLYFGDPYNIQVSYFRLYSERSTVVTFKNMPFTDSGMKEWLDRLMSMNAVTVGEDGYYVKNKTIFEDMTPKEKLDYCKRYDATHLIIKANFNVMVPYEDLGFVIEDWENNWFILKVPQ